MQEGQGRFAALDGLRGLAAFVVLISHALLVSRDLGRGDDAHRAGLSVLEIWLTYSPLHLLWAGISAVFVFFVLSGFVLALPFLRATGQPLWRAYYPARLLRLYVPVWAAVVFAAVLVLAVPRDAVPGMSWWVAGHDTPLTASTLAGDLTLTSPSWHNSPLWSLRYEVAFSLLLPVYLWVGTRLRSEVAAALGAVVLFGVCGVGALIGNPWLVHMPMFGLGTLMAVHKDRLLQAARRVHPVAWFALAAAAILLLTAKWLPVLDQFGSPAMLLGAVLTVYVFLGCPAAIRLATTRPVRQLGAWSFSLYLVHEPIVVTIAFLIPDAPLAVTLPLSIVTALVAAWIFFRLVEAPAHRLSKAVGRRASVRSVGLQRV